MSKVTLFISYRFIEFGNLVQKVKSEFQSIKNIVEIKDLGETAHLADDRNPNTKSIETILQEGDYFLGLLGDTYKLIENTSTSIIKNEYDASIKKGCKIFSYYIGRHSNETTKYLTEIPDYFKYEGNESNVEDARKKAYKKLCSFKNELFQIKSDKDRISGYFSTEKDLDEMAKEIYSSIHTYIISLLKQKEFVKQLNGVPEIPENYIVRKNDLKKLKEKILSKSLNIGITGKVVGIKGLGGVGKSVLANAVVREPEILENYTEIYWATINQNPTKNDIKGKLIKILTHIDNDTDYGNHSLDQISIKLENEFVNKKVILIVDDVWDIKDLKHFNFINYNTSKRLITSRRESVLADADTFNLSVLSKEQAFELFKKRVIVDSSQKSQLAKELLEQTGYLALAVSIISAMLKSKSIEYWEKVLNDFKSSKLNKVKFDNENELHENLFALINVSYNYLNEEEQYSFKKLVLFPESFQINRNTLKVYFGSDYFELINKLVDDSLLIDNKDNTYSLHDLIRDFVIIKAKEQINLFKKTFIESYFEYYHNKWNEFDFQYENNDHFFLLNLIDFANETDLQKKLLKATKEILYLEYTPRKTVLSIIKLLGLNKVQIAKELLWKNKSSYVFSWIISVLGLKDEQVKKFAKNYLNIDNENLNAKMTIKSMDVLGFNEEQVKTFAEHYLTIDNKNINDSITIKSMDVLGLDNQQVKTFAKDYLNIDNENLNDKITIKSMDVLGLDNQQVIKFAQDYLNIDNKNINDSITIKSMDALGLKDQQVITFAKDYLSIDNKNINAKMTIRSMDVLGLDDKQVIKFAKHYLTIDNNNINDSITIKSIDVLGLNDEQVITFAQDYLKIDNKNLNGKIIVKSMDVLGLDNQQVITFAKNYLKIDDNYLNDHITIKSMDVLGLDNQQVITFAKNYLKIDDNNLNDHITIKSMDVIGLDDEQVITFAKDYLSIDNKNISDSITIKSMDVLGFDDEQVKTFAKDYLAIEKKYINHSIAIKSIDILGFKNEQVRKFAQDYLDIDNKSLNESITIKLMDVLGLTDEQVIAFANSYITNIQISKYNALAFKCFVIIGNENNIVVNILKDYLLTSDKKNSYRIISSIRILGYDSEYSKQFARQFLNNYTTFWSKEHNWLNNRVRAEILLTETNTDTRINISKFLLKGSLDEIDRSFLFASLKVLQNNTSIDLSVYFEEILHNWKSQLFRNNETYPYYQNHIIFSIENSINKRLIEKTKKEILNFNKEPDIQIGESLLKTLNGES